MGEVKEQYQVTSRNKFAAVENLEDSGYISKAWDNTMENIKILAQKSLGCCKSKHHKPCFDDVCFELVDRRKQANLQRLQDPSEVNENNLSNVWQEASRYFRNKRREYLKDEINKLELNSKNKNIRDLYRV
jgi:hypothetical protein